MSDEGREYYQPFSTTELQLFYQIDRDNILMGVPPIFPRLLFALNNPSHPKTREILGLPKPRRKLRVVKR